jgi:hypothetical protein
MRLYGGIFLIAFAMLAVEIALLRLLSAISWYHLAFFAISTAMLGMTVGATTVYLKPNWFTPKRLHIHLAKASFGFALAVPIALAVLCVTPMGFFGSIASLLSFLLVTAACALPFYFSGLVITVVLTKGRLPIGRLYASDLVGASLGCLFVLAGLEFLDAPSFILLCGAIGIIAGLVFAWRELSEKSRWLAVLALALLVGLSLVNSSIPRGVAPLFAKGKRVDQTSRLLEKWNSFSQVTVFKAVQSRPRMWGPSPVAPIQPTIQYYMTIDGEAGTSIRRFTTFAAAAAP